MAGHGETFFSTSVKVMTSRRVFIIGIQAISCLSMGIAAITPDYISRPAALVAFVIAVLVMGAGLLFARLAVEDVRQQRLLFQEAQAAKQQVEELFAMTDMLQAAEDHEDAGTVLMATACRLMPDLSGALYVFNNSRDRLDLAKSWRVDDAFSPGIALLPSNCWALKRGKVHTNDFAPASLTCTHQVGTAATLEIPMLARGQVHGLLILGAQGEDAAVRLNDVRRVANALSDSMSLALSNIALREKLRTQSLRDPLTGLYNRRYMEDALERYVSLGERSGNATSVLMIDLDNFKRLNDEHGHAKGDAVLRDVASQLVTALRQSDVVARYGGEELVVILPNCGLEDAASRAELLRMRIESLSDPHGAQISASFGVATVPQTATSTADVIPMADSALYAAKKAGKNRVVCADKRHMQADHPLPRLAITA